MQKAQIKKGARVSKGSTFMTWKEENTIFDLVEDGIPDRAQLINKEGVFYTDLRNITFLSEREVALLETIKTLKLERSDRVKVLEEALKPIVDAWVEDSLTKSLPDQIKLAVNVKIVDMRNAAKALGGE